MRRYAVLIPAALLVLLTACGRQPALESTSPQSAADAQTKLAQPTDAADETELPIDTTSVTTTTQPPETTKRPPVLTTQPSSAAGTRADVSEQTQPHESGSVPFTAKSVRIYRAYAEPFKPTAAAVDSRAALKDTLRSFADDEHTDGVAGYTDEWFKTHRLIVVSLQESSGSNRHDVRSVAYARSGATVKIERIIPEVGTCDIAQWLIFVELPDTRLHTGDPVEVILS